MQRVDLGVDASTLLTQCMLTQHMLRIYSHERQRT